MDIFKRVAYLQQFSECLLEMDGQSLANHRLVSVYGHLMREISLKHQIHSMGCHQYKQRRCRKCFSIVDHKNCRIKRKFMITRCPNCGQKKKYRIARPVKTHYEKCLQELTLK